MNYKGETIKVKMKHNLLCIAMLALVVLSGCVTSKQSAPNTAPDDVSAVKVVNGIQEVTLSWGRFNYAPEVIKVKQGMPVKLTADLKRLQGCYRALEIPGMGISKYFRSGDDTLEFTPERTGTYDFSCSMGMGTGTLIVE